MADDGRSVPNAALLETSFLYGANALFVEEMQARYAKDPASVDPSWRAFFAGLGEGADAAAKAVAGPSWKDPRAGQAATNEITALLDGNWGALETRLTKKIAEVKPGASIADIQTAARDSVKALMMIRAYRTRGHLAANLDPLGIEQHGPQPELDPASYGFGPDDLDRPIFIDYVLGLETATVRQM
ncbi:MAG: 2-oxoglutarate dehydrogenase E1 component, partial [Alphaproteobacteria bacterium]|nr:2-oxoglutarate dehydrogenase E1 component [Alphaproteobacteria bacterium]